MTPKQILDSFSETLMQDEADSQSSQERCRCWPLCCSMPKASTKRSNPETQEAVRAVIFVCGRLETVAQRAFLRCSAAVSSSAFWKAVHFRLDSNAGENLRHRCREKDSGTTVSPQARDRCARRVYLRRPERLRTRTGPASKRFARPRKGEPDPPSKAPMLGLQACLCRGLRRSEPDPPTVRAPRKAVGLAQNAVAEAERVRVAERPAVLPAEVCGSG